MNAFRWARKLTPYAAAVGLCALALCFVFDLRHADLNVPFRVPTTPSSAQTLVKTAR